MSGSVYGFCLSKYSYALSACGSIRAFSLSVHEGYLPDVGCPLLSTPSWSGCAMPKVTLVNDLCSLSLASSRDYAFWSQDCLLLGLGAFLVVCVFSPLPIIRSPVQEVMQLFCLTWPTPVLKDIMFIDGWEGLWYASPLPYCFF